MHTIARLRPVCQTMSCNVQPKLVLQLLFGDLRAMRSDHRPILCRVGVGDCPIYVTRIVSGICKVIIKHARLRIGLLFGCFASLRKGGVSNSSRVFHQEWVFPLHETNLQPSIFVSFCLSTKVALVGMPYTPAVARAAVAPQSDTPSWSNSPSDSQSQQRDDTLSGPVSRTPIPSIPAFRAYTRRHRRSLSISKSPFPTAGYPTPAALVSEVNNSEIDDKNTAPALGDIRQSSIDSSTSSTETSSAELSSPLSPPTSGDDEATARGGRLSEKPDPAELQAAIEVIEQHRLGLAHKPISEKLKKSSASVGISLPRPEIYDRGNALKAEVSPSVFVSSGARTSLPSSSSTSALPDLPRKKSNSLAWCGSEDESNERGYDDLSVKPALIRKMSGELVRPALRAPSRRRHSSMPATPIPSKAVHFQENGLEDICHFLRGEHPAAVSNSSSPEASDDNEINLPFDNFESGSRSRAFNWEVQSNDFPRQSPEGRRLPVRIEQMYLSSDSQLLVGIVAVRNLAFHKLVVARFTLDYWKTTSEVVAEFDHKIMERQTNDGYDQFVFNIKLGDQVRLESKIMSFCVRYDVNAQEYWDNNHSMNYQLHFSKKVAPGDSELCMQAKHACLPNALPHIKPLPISASRSRSGRCPDDSKSLDWFSLPHQPSPRNDNCPIGLKTRPRAMAINPHAPNARRDQANQQVLGNRYDFDTSLAVAVQASYPALGDRSSGRSGKHVTPLSESRPALEPGPEECWRPRVTKIQPASLVDGIPITNSEAGRPTIPGRSKSAALIAKTFPLQSSSYSDLLDKYCFVSPEDKKAIKDGRLIYTIVWE